MKLTALLFMFLLLCIFSCKKFKESEIFFSFTDEYSEWLSHNGSLFSQGKITISFKSGLKYTGNLNWKDAVKSSLGDYEIVIVPFVFKGSFYKSGKVIYDKAASELPSMYHMIFWKNKEGIIAANLRVRGYDENAANDPTHRRKVLTAFYNLQGMYQKAAFVYGNKDFAVLTNEQPVTITGRMSNCYQIVATQRRVSCTGGMDNTTCTFYSTINVTSFCTATDPGENQIPQFDEGGGGWIEYQYSIDEYQNQSIIDSLQGHPCAQDILKELPSCNDLTASVLTNVFGVSKQINVIFKADPNLPVDGRTQSTYTVSGTSFNATILLNANFLETAPREYIVKTMLHESIHAFIDYQWSRYITNQVDSNTFKTDYPLIWNYKNSMSAQHELMAQIYIQALKDIIANFNPFTSNDMKNALAWKGLSGTEAWKKLGADTSQFKQLYFDGRNQDSTTMSTHHLSKCN